MRYRSNILLALLCLLVFSVYAEHEKPIPMQRAIEMPAPRSISTLRNPPTYTFSRTPVTLLTSYYDYMIGGYNGLPLCLIPDSAGAGYFMTYHGTRTAVSSRRVFHAYIDESGTLINNNEISLYGSNMVEGYPTMAVDPVSGKPMYAWHANTDADNQKEVMFVTDAFIDCIDALWNDYQTIINNPTNITTPAGTTTDNEFIWPTAVIGPSPINGKRRVYVACSNSVTHAGIPVGNVLIAYADFDGDIIENGYPFVWSYTSIPELNLWNAGINSHSPNYALACDNAGNLYYLGYHTSYDTEGNIVHTPGIDVFKCPSYGAGTWVRVTWEGTLPTWNPPSGPGLQGYFVNEETNTPFANEELFWKMHHSNHSNAGVDDLGRIHYPGLWFLSNSTGAYYPSLNYVKELVYDTQSGTLSVNEVFPKRSPEDNFNQAFAPWDMEAPWGVVDEFIEDGSGGSYPYMVSDWNFPYWDMNSHNNAMMNNCSNMKVTNSNGYGMMAMVWQNSHRSQMFNVHNNFEYQNYMNVPEIYISVSSNNGYSWSEPIILNSEECPQLANMKPMWVYPADKVKYMGINQNGEKIGKLGLMFYDDYSWGSNAIASSEFPNDGGRVMFAELQIVFPNLAYPPPPPPTDPFGVPITYAGSMNLLAKVMINNQMANSNDVVAAYATANGITQLRGKGTVAINQGVAICQMQIFTQSNGEEISFKHWGYATGVVTDMAETLVTEVGGSVGSWPDNLFLLHEYVPNSQSLSMQAGWNMVSLNVEPEDYSISSIFSGVSDYLQAIKCPAGVYIPSNPFNTLSSLSEGKGYFVKLSSLRFLQVLGDPVNASNPITLARGWNLVGFNPQNALFVDEALASIANTLVQVKGAEGVYEPDNPFSTLSTMSPGCAYWIKTSAAATLVYPGSGKALAQNLLPGNKQWGSPIIKTNSQSVLVRLENARQGDVLAAFVGEELRGLAPITTHNGVSATLLQVFSEEAGELITFKLHNSETGDVSALYPSLSSLPGESVGSYAQGEYYTLQSEQDTAPELVTSLLSAYPNPFKDTASIALQVGKDNEAIKLEIYNLRGQKINTLFNATMEAGNHRLQWNGMDDKGNSVASGIYFVRLTGDVTTQNMKLMVLK